MAGWGMDSGTAQRDGGPDGGAHTAAAEVGIDLQVVKDLEGMFLSAIADFALSLMLIAADDSDGHRGSHWYGGRGGSS